LHTALDTSGFATERLAQRVLPYVDLLLLDFKSYNPQRYHELTCAKIERPLNTLRVAHALRIPTQINYVLVPEITDDEKDLCEMATFLKQYENIQKIAVLPFHKHGEHKWEELHIEYKLRDVQPPSAEQVARVQGLFN
jgi:pyruvate formate lyase activating enzyme